MILQEVCRKNFLIIKSKDVVKLLQENGFEAKSAQSVIEDDAIGFSVKAF